MLIGESPPHSPRLATLIITSEASTHLALLELSVPCWEERIDEASESKHTVQGNSGRVQGQRRLGDDVVRPETARIHHSIAYVLQTAKVSHLSS